MRMTSAPWSANISASNGPATYCPKVEDLYTFEHPGHELAGSGAGAPQGTRLSQGGLRERCVENGWQTSARRSYRRLAVGTGRRSCGWGACLIQW